MAHPHTTHIPFTDRLMHIVHKTSSTLLRLMYQVDIMHTFEEEQVFGFAKVSGIRLLA